MNIHMHIFVCVCGGGWGGGGFPASGKEPTCHCRRQTWVWSLGREDPLEEGMATHSSILFLIKFIYFFNWRVIVLQNFLGFCQTSTWIGHRYTYVPSLLNVPPISLPIPQLQVVTDPPLQYSYLENPEGKGAWHTIVHRVVKSQTWLKRISMHAYVYIYVCVYTYIQMGISFLFAFVFRFSSFHNYL